MIFGVRLMFPDHTSSLVRVRAGTIQEAVDKVIAPYRKIPWGVTVLRGEIIQAIYDVDRMADGRLLLVRTHARAS